MGAGCAVLKLRCVPPPHLLAIEALLAVLNHYRGDHPFTRAPALRRRLLAVLGLELGLYTE